MVKRILYKIIYFISRKIEINRPEYYKYLFNDKVFFGKNILLRKGASIVFLDNNPSSLLQIGDDVELRQNCIITLMSGGKIKVGNGVFFNNSCSVTALGEIEIGANTLFGEGVKIYDHNHIYKGNELIRNQGFTIGKISIGKNCWFGSNCVVLNNVVIGDNVVVGANTVIHKSIPSNTLVYTKAAVVERQY